MKILHQGWDDFWAVLFRVKHRQSIPGIQHYDQLLVEFCLDVLELSPGQKLLDIACGAGTHCVEFAKRKIEVTGFDITYSLIEVAEENAKSAQVNVDLFTADMREIDFDNRFDAAVLLSHSFGFFNHEENKTVLDKTFHALGKNGKLLLDLINPYNIPRFQKTWVKIDNGYLLIEPHVLDAQAGVLRGRPALFIDVNTDSIIMANEDAMSSKDIRMYTALEIREMLEEVGFTVIKFYGQNKLPRMPYTSLSDRMVVVATK